ncbi:hypothetical protein DAI22_12g041200 [Oryza sativa Japonica Group]|nr:hypothetical protein DAI22_12g041200 [Oryza sativa Japonica Group]
MTALNPIIQSTTPHAGQSGQWQQQAGRQWLDPRARRFALIDSSNLPSDHKCFYQKSHPIATTYSKWFIGS